MAVHTVNHFELFALMPEHRLALCITPKAASMSIIDALARHYRVPVLRPSHRYSVFRWFTLEQLQAVAPDWRLAMFVRHPLKRLCSVYDYHITQHNLERSANMRERFWPDMTFPEFVDVVIDDPYWDSHFLPQSAMTYGADYVGKFESLTADWRAFRDWAGVELPDLAHINGTRKNRRCSLDELSNGQRRELMRIYARDFEEFGYR